jgi:hypothetical protein
VKLRLKKHEIEGEVFEMREEEGEPQKIIGGEYD